MATSLAPTTDPLLADGLVQSLRPDTAQPAYLRMLARSKVCRDLMIGLEAIRAGGADYLPRFPKEDDDSYAVRQNLAALSNGFARAVYASVGLLLQTPPAIGDDMPSPLVALAENIDLAGTHLDVFAWNLFLWAIVDGRAGILVDYPRVENPQAVSADDERRRGLRPYWVLVQSPDIFLVLHEPIHGARTLTLLIIREQVRRRYGPYGVAPVSRFRVYSRETTGVTYEIWETQPGAVAGTLTQTVPPMPMRNVSEIPFALFSAGHEVAPGEIKPPLLDLAELTIEHHQIKTDIRHLEMLACVPTLVRKGYQAPVGEDGKPNPAGVTLGPRSVQDIPADGSLEWMTPNITVLDPAMKSLANNENAQGAAGLAFLSPDNRARETAEAKRIDAAAQNATLAVIGRRGQDALEMAFGFTAAFMNTTAGSVSISTDFENTILDAATMTAYGTLAANGKLSLETLLDMLEKGKRLPDGFNVEEEKRRILSEGAMPDPTPPVPPVVPPATGDAAA